MCFAHHLTASSAIKQIALCIRNPTKYFIPSLFLFSSSLSLKRRSFYSLFSCFHELRRANERLNLNVVKPSIQTWLETFSSWSPALSQSRVCMCCMPLASSSSHISHHSYTHTARMNSTLSDDTNIFFIKILRKIYLINAKPLRVITQNCFWHWCDDYASFFHKLSTWILHSALYCINMTQSR